MTQIRATHGQWERLRVLRLNHPDIRAVGEAHGDIVVEWTYPDGSTGRATISPSGRVVTYEH